MMIHIKSSVYKEERGVRKFRRNQHEIELASTNKFPVIWSRNVFGSNRILRVRTGPDKNLILFNSWVDSLFKRTREITVQIEPWFVWVAVDPSL